jgi:hypothetical protein
MSKQFPLFEPNGEQNDYPLSERNKKYSDYIVYVDESGDHSLQSIDANFPIFVLAFCVFHKRYYSETVVSTLQKFKFNQFGHDIVVLHEREIRKAEGAFSSLQNQSERQQFIDQLTQIIDTSKFVLISCVINKSELRSKAQTATNPYDIALDHCLETLYEFLEEKQQHKLITHVIVERRGKKEDNELELEFRRVCAGENRWGSNLPFQVVFADKRVNSAGLQLADLVARPIGLGYLRPAQENRAFDVLKKKFFCSGGRPNVGKGYEGLGLKIYPAPESERPR